jgi:hypothetical protein
MTEQTIFWTVLICTSLVVLTPHLWVRDPVTPLPSLPAMAPGCIGDMLVGYLDCFTVFPDGTWLRTRGY